MQQATLVPGFIIHRRNYSETSFIVEVFTRESGLVGLMARGARRSSGRAQNALQPFQPLLFSWRGKGELPTMTACEPNGFGPVLTGAKLVSGMYLNELVGRLLQRGDPHPDLFDAYRGALIALEHSEVEPVLRSFEVRLLANLGYGLQLTEVAATGEPVVAGRRYWYDADGGPREQDGPGCVAGETLLALDRGLFDSELVRRESKALMRRLLHPHLGDKPLVSRKLLRR